MSAREYRLTLTDEEADEVVNGWAPTRGEIAWNIGRQIKAQFPQTCKPGDRLRFHDSTDRFTVVRDLETSELRICSDTFATLVKGYPIVVGVLPDGFSLIEDEA